MNSRSVRFLVILRISGFLIAIHSLLLTGCSDGGRPRYHLSGQVTWRGEAIPAGSITLTPDSSQDNRGPAISVPIQDGRFDTKQQGEGHVGGPHVVKIIGLDGNVSEDFSEGMPLFPPFETKRDLPQQASSQDIEIPADWAPMPQMTRPFDSGP
jgi:hypothetical protein